MKSNLYLISGSDEIKIFNQANEISIQLAGKTPDEFNYDVIQPSDEIDYQQMILNCIESLNTPSLLGTKTIWLKDFPFDKEPKTTDLHDFAKQFDQLIKLLDNLQGMKLIMSGIGINRVKRLYKVVSKLGKTIIFDKIDMKDRGWQKKITDEINLIATKKKLDISLQIKEYLVQLIGSENNRIETELEKLACLFYHQPIKDLKKVQDLCSGGKQTAFWSLSNALGKRNLEQSFDIINRFLISSKNDTSACIGLLSNIANFFEQLIHCRLLMQTLKTKSANNVEQLLKSLSQEEKEEKFSDNHVLNLHPYRLKMLCQDALNFSGKDLIKFYHLIVDSNRYLISTQISPRLILENLSTHIALR